MEIRFRPGNPRGPRLAFKAATGACLFVLLSVSVTGVPSAQPKERVYDSLELSGTATSALSQASGMLPHANRSPSDAPLNLMSYTVQMLQRPNEIVVAFYPDTGAVPFVVHISSAGVISHDNVLPTVDVPPIVVPGVTAGAIVAAYGKAKAESDVVTKRGPANFGTAASILSGRTLVAFIPSKQSPPTGTRECAGNCNGRSVYLVTVQQSGTTVSRRAIL
jgi:hypothetical protein